MNTMKYITFSIVVTGALAITSLFGCSSGVSLVEFETLQADYDGVCADLATTEATLANQRTDLDHAFEDLVDADSDLETTQASLTTTKATLETTQTSLATVQATLANNQTELTDTEGILTTTQGTLATIQATLAETEATLLTTQAELASTQTTLVETEVTLASVQSDLDSTEGTLADTEGTVASTQAQLTTTQETLATTQTMLASTQSLLTTTQAELTATEEDVEFWEFLSDSWESQYVSKNTDYNTLVTWYDGIRQTINDKAYIGEHNTSYITPDDSSVAAKVLEITGGFSADVNEQWDDYKRLYDWVVNNVEYSYDSGLPILPEINGDLTWDNDYWRMPAETLADETGDCEDMAALLASMRLNYTASEGYTSWLISWVSDDTAHMAVAFPVAGGKITILDPSGQYYSWSTQGSDLLAFDVELEIDYWLNTHWAGYTGIYIYSVCTADYYVQFDTTDDFITWFNDRYS
jgi:peptidoglycan hydrolase CwlO-like protein